MCKKIKENITFSEYKKLIAYVKGVDNIREHTRTNLLRTFTILFFTGLRLNEVQELKIEDIKELLSTGSVKIYLSKTNSQRKLYLSNMFKKELLKLFDFTLEDNQNLIVCKGANKNKKTKINNIVFIQHINTILKQTLGEGYTSHSFRQGLITEMGSKGVNIKIISNFIGHKSVQTTMGYIKPTDEDIINSLIR